MIENHPVLTLAPPLLAILLAIVTRRVLLSLGAGVVLAALLIAEFAPGESLRRVWDAFAAIFWVDGALNGQVYILLFILMLGLIAAFVLMSGGTRAFADWAGQRIRSRRGAQGLAGGLGIAIFVDDYFNALAVGQVARPVTDRQRVSRAKLAYLIDSTSAPVAVLAPFSSWGAYIMGLIAPLAAAAGLTVSTLPAFLLASVANFYAIAAIAMVGLMIWLRLDLGPMRREELRAYVEGRPHAEGAEIPGQLSADLPVHQPGARRALIVPFFGLVVGVLAGIAWTGHRATGSWHPIDVLESTDVNLSLVVGGILGLGLALYYYLRYTASNPRFSGGAFTRGCVEGIRSMLPACAILLLAWTLGTLIEELGTGEYLGTLMEDSDLPAAWLVPLAFVLAAGMAFATGSSWGSFGLLLPITGGLVAAVDAPELLLPAFGAVLAGAVAGDHSSPISDTTILSSTGAGCHVITHVVTQLPYVFLAGGAALAGYVVLAVSGSTLAGLATTLLVLLAMALLLRSRLRPIEDETQADCAPLT